MQVIQSSSSLAGQASNGEKKQISLFNQDSEHTSGVGRRPERSSPHCVNKDCEHKLGVGRRPELFSRHGKVKSTHQGRTYSAGQSLHFLTNASDTH